MGALYKGSAEEKQGAIFIDAHFAANAVGATNPARPEDTDASADGTLFIAFTLGGPSGDGGPHNAIFQGPNSETPYEHGWIMKLQETSNDPAAMTSSWEMMALGSELTEGGFGLSNPDNLEVGGSGNFMDGDGHVHQQAQPSGARSRRRSRQSCQPVQSARPLWQQLRVINYHLWPQRWRSPDVWLWADGMRNMRPLRHTGSDHPVPCRPAP